MKIVQTCCVWNSMDMPKGYQPVAMLVLDPANDIWVSVGMPVAALEKMAGKDFVALLLDTLGKELYGMERSGDLKFRKVKAGDDGAPAKQGGVVAP